MVAVVSAVPTLVLPPPVLLCPKSPLAAMGHGPVSSFSFVIAHEIGWSFGNITKPFKSLVRTFKSPNQLSHTLLVFICLWLLKPLTRLLHGFVVIPNDQPIPYYLPIN